MGPPPSPQTWIDEKQSGSSRAARRAAADVEKKKEKERAAADKEAAAARAAADKEAAAARAAAAKEAAAARAAEARAKKEAARQAAPRGRSGARKRPAADDPGVPDGTWSKSRVRSLSTAQLNDVCEQFGIGDGLVDKEDKVNEIAAHLGIKTQQNPFKKPNPPATAPVLFSSKPSPLHCPNRHQHRATDEDLRT